RAAPAFQFATRELSSHSRGIFLALSMEGLQKKFALLHQTTDSLGVLKCKMHGYLLGRGRIRALYGSEKADVYSASPDQTSSECPYAAARTSCFWKVEVTTSK